MVSLPLLERRADSERCIAQPSLNFAHPIHGTLTFHDLMIYIAAGMTGLCCICSAVMALWHLFNYTRPREQKQLIRIVITPSIFAIFSVFGTWKYTATNYLTPIAELYECFALVSVFMLLLAYLAPSPAHEQREYFSSLGPPPGAKSRNLTTNNPRWFSRVWLSVFQILPTRIITVIANEIVQAEICYGTKKYWRADTVISTIQGALTAFCLLAILRFYVRFRRELHAVDPRLLVKLVAFKSIVFVQLLQRIILTALAKTGRLKATAHLSYNDLAIGLMPFLTCIEACLFALAFLWPYSAGAYAAAARGGGDGAGGGKLGFGCALLDALNIFDVVQGIMASRSLHRDVGADRASNSGQVGQVNEVEGRDDGGQDGQMERK